MSDSRVAGGLDRLPWLSDELAPKKPVTKRTSRDLTGWAVASIFVIAGASFWLGSRSNTGTVPRHSTFAPGSATVRVPASPRAHPQEVNIAPQPQVAPVPQPEVRVIRVPEIRIVPAPAAKESVPQVKQSRSDGKPAAATSSTTEKNAKPAMTIAAPSPKIAPVPALRAWPPRITAGAYGRLVQIGAYGSRIQAKRGWVKMVRAYPAVAHLPAVVVVTRNSRGRLFYRFQIGTTSQAHSEVLCQRMDGIQLSCAVVGLPWKAKVER